MATVRIKDVARAAGVSVGTVSNVLNRPETVAGATLQRVRAAIETTGFVPNAAAGKLRSAANRTLGLVIPDIGNPYLSDVARGVVDTAEELGYVVMLCNSDTSAEREANHLRFLAEQRVAGAIVMPQRAGDPASQFDSLTSTGAAVLLLDGLGAGDAQCAILVDDLAGGEAAGRHLVSLGRRRIVMVTGLPGFRPFDDRLAGLRQAAASYADPVTVDVVRCAGLAPHDVDERLDDIIALAPDAVFCANDVAALALMRGLRAKGISIPDDVAIVGYDDIMFAALAPVPLTSVRQPARELGALAARMLVEEVSGSPHDHRRVVLMPELIVRESSRMS